MQCIYKDWYIVELGREGDVEVWVEESGRITKYLRPQILKKKKLYIIHLRKKGEVDFLLHGEIPLFITLIIQGQMMRAPI